MDVVNRRSNSKLYSACDQPETYVLVMCALREITNEVKRVFVFGRVECPSTVQSWCQGLCMKVQRMWSIFSSNAAIITQEAIDHPTTISSTQKE